MESACVYEQATVIHELNQGIQMAKQLRVNLGSAEARELLIEKILSSYDNALSILKSGGQPRATPSSKSSLPKSSTSTDSTQNGEFEFKSDHNVVSKKRKSSSTDIVGDILPSSFSFPSTRFAFSDDEFEQPNFPNHFDDELLMQGYSPPFISPDTSESSYFTDWSSSPSLDLDLDPNFKFRDSFF